MESSECVFAACQPQRYPRRLISEAKLVECEAGEDEMSAEWKSDGGKIVRKFYDDLLENAMDFRLSNGLSLGPIWGPHLTGTATGEVK